MTSLFSYHWANRTQREQEALDPDDLSQFPIHTKMASKQLLSSHGAFEKASKSPGVSSDAVHKDTFSFKICHTNSTKVMLLHMACNLLLHSSYGFEEQITIETFSPETLHLIMNLFICQQLTTQGLKGISCSVSL